jgi:hypothetical protein
MDMKCHIHMFGVAHLWITFLKWTAELEVVICENMGSRRHRRILGFSSILKKDHVSPLAKDTIFQLASGQTLFHECYFCSKHKKL